MRRLVGGRRDNVILVKRLLREAGGRPRRRLGQSFLVDPAGIDVFVGAILRAGGGWWLELGTGPGLLTCEVAGRAGPVVGYEIDPVVARVAGRLCDGEGRALIVHGDGLKALGTWRGPVYSNTPYNLSSRIISVLARSEDVDVAVLGVQHELALRITASPGSREYGRLTVLARLFFDVEYAGFLRREWFYPAPKVNGAVLILRRRRGWDEELEALEDFTACLFHQRNKNARKVVRRCTRGTVDDPGLAGRRVRDLGPEEVLEVYLGWRRGSSRQQG